MRILVPFESSYQTAKCLDDVQLYYQLDASCRSAMLMDEDELNRWEGCRLAICTHAMYLNAEVRWRGRYGDAWSQHLADSRLDALWRQLRDARPRRTARTARPSWWGTRADHEADQWRLVHLAPAYYLERFDLVWPM